MEIIQIISCGRTRLYVVLDLAAFNCWFVISTSSTIDLLLHDVYGLVSWMVCKFL